MWYTYYSSFIIGVGYLFYLVADTLVPVSAISSPTISSTVTTLNENFFLHITTFKLNDSNYLDWTRAVMVFL